MSPVDRCGLSFLGVLDDNQTEVGWLVADLLGRYLLLHPRDTSEIYSLLLGFRLCPTGNKTEASRVNLKMLDYVQNSVRHPMGYEATLCPGLVFGLGLHRCTSRKLFIQGSSFKEQYTCRY